MGCWNATCAISRLPIHSGDDVMCWYITGSPFTDDASMEAKDFCYPHDHFQLFGIPFRAKYNDYGSIENVNEDDQVILDSILNVMKDNLVEFPLGENQYHDIAVTKANFDFDVCCEAIHEARLQMAGFYTAGKPVGLMMIHLGIFEKFMAEYQWKDYFRDSENNFKSKMVGFDIEAKALAKKAEWDAESVINPNETEEQQIVRQFKQKMAKYNDREYQCMAYLGQVRENMEAEAQLDPTAMLKYFRGVEQSNALDALAHVMRFAYMPQCGAGSQTDDQEPYEMLLVAMKEQMIKAKNRFGDYDEEDDE